MTKGLEKYVYGTRNPAVGRGNVVIKLGIVKDSLTLKEIMV
jgi:hypothetical protein